MLLACPNCDARYDVPDNAIPENGRDVQCSNCGHAWFQLPMDAAEALEDEDLSVTLAIQEREAPAGAKPPPGASYPPEIAEDIIEEEEVVISALPPGDEAGFDTEDEAEPDAGDDTESATEAPTGTDALKAALTGKTPAAAAGEAVAAAVAAPAPRRELDDAVLSILRDEAERETSARKAEAQRNSARRAEAETGLQSQPELSMPTPEMTAQQKRLAMLRGEDLDEPDPEPTRPMARRDLLPDVEEINSTLQPDEARFDPDAEVDSLPDLTRGSFRTGFLLAMLVLVIAALVYVFSDRIAVAVPALEPALQSYVAFVDNLRGWLNSMMDSATQALTSEGSSGS